MGSGEGGWVGLLQILQEVICILQPDGDANEAILQGQAKAQ